MQSVSSQIDRITIQLDKHKNNLSKDIKLLDGLYQQNKDYFDDVNLYIAAAKRKHEIKRTTFRNYKNLPIKLVIKWICERIWSNLLIA